MSLELVKNAELLVKKKHSGMMRKDDTTPYSKHLAEVQLILSDFKAVGKNLKALSIKNIHLEEKFNNLLEYLRTKSIDIPNF